MSKPFQTFAVGKRCVCIWKEKPFAAQILSISDGCYLVHYIGFANWDFGIGICQEGGIRFNGTLQEYALRYNATVSSKAYQYAEVDDYQPAGPMQMNPYGRPYARKIFVYGDDSSRRRRSRRFTLGGPSTNTRGVCSEVLCQCLQ
ncbi:hypothetical protein B9Z55_028103 [Caenorhabditis nigoni]|uniref:Uncharacterized protein n=1 Tax=Caenorhabditis nigoni TaxID=1611254 RepID=A0A2G5SD77_9PELO|nr:hypothetical protein B9Z55_028103 [Caenorhabditis nigoni]